MPAKNVVNFDHFSAEYAGNWPTTIQSFHAGCPVVWTDAHGGYWVLADYDAVKQAADDYSVFSSDNDINNERRGTRGIMIPPAPFRLTLNEEDPPQSIKYRMLEAPFFTPKYLGRWKEVARRHADDCIDAMLSRGSGDFIYDLALPVPAKTTLQIVGIDVADWEAFAMPAHTIAYMPSSDPAYPIDAILDLNIRLGDLFDRRREEPREDVASRLAHAKVDGEPLPREVAVGMLFALVTGGFDTTTTLIANGLYWLEDKHDIRERLLGDTQLMDNAIEEFLRAFPPTHGTARNVVQDIELSGQQLKTGERVLLSWASANHDPKKFECPFDVRIDRPNAREHQAFGGGAHRCLGAPLAKAEAKIVIEAVLRRMPDYRIDRERTRRYPTSGMIAGFIDMPTACGSREG